VTSSETAAADALSAVEGITRRVASPRASQEHWFKVTDKGGSIHEFSLDADTRS